MLDATEVGQNLGPDRRRVRRGCRCTFRERQVYGEGQLTPYLWWSQARAIVELLLTRGKMRLPEILEAMSVTDDIRETLYPMIDPARKITHKLRSVHSRQEEASQARSEPSQHVPHPANIRETVHCTVRRHV